MQLHMVTHLWKISISKVWKISISKVWKISISKVWNRNPPYSKFLHPFLQTCVLDHFCSHIPLRLLSLRSCGSWYMMWSMYNYIRICHCCPRDKKNAHKVFNTEPFNDYQMPTKWQVMPKFTFSVNQSANMGPIYVMPMLLPSGHEMSWASHHGRFFGIS